MQGVFYSTHKETISGVGIWRNKMGPIPKSGDDSLDPGPLDPDMDRR